MSLFGENLDSGPKNDQLTSSRYSKNFPKKWAQSFLTIYQNLSSSEKSEK